MTPETCESCASKQARIEELEKRIQYLEIELCSRRQTSSSVITEIPDTCVEGGV
jgi:hypothetical protein